MSNRVCFEDKEPLIPQEEIRDALEISKSNNNELENTCQTLFDNKIVSLDQVGSLPEGVFENVFAFLSFSVIFKTCTLVRKRWQTRIKSDAMAKRFGEELSKKFNLPNTIENMRELKFEYIVLPILKNFYITRNIEKPRSSIWIKFSPDQKIRFACYYGKNSFILSGKRLEPETIKELENPYQGKESISKTRFINIVCEDAPHSIQLRVHFSVIASEQEYERFFKRHELFFFQELENATESSQSIAGVQPAPQTPTRHNSLNTIMNLIRRLGFRRFG